MLRKEDSIPLDHEQTNNLRAVSFKISGPSVCVVSSYERIFELAIVRLSDPKLQTTLSCKPSDDKTCHETNNNK
jgi:hypothetical protein